MRRRTQRSCKVSKDDSRREERKFGGDTRFYSLGEDREMVRALHGGGQCAMMRCRERDDEMNRR